MKKIYDSRSAILRVLTVSLSTLILVLPVLKASCFNNSSIGESKCIQVDRYNARQWATCVSDLYIRQKSKGQHGCLGNKMYCIYQCMLEVHDSNYGDVTQQCECSLSALTTNNTPVLPKWCFSPNGGECNWYRSCLTRRYKSTEVKGFNEEIVAFAEQFCELYLNPYSQFTAASGLWLNGVRKCILVSLVPLLRPWQEENSSEILTRNAIVSFSRCYVSSFPGIPSICQVPLVDLWTIFWHLRQTLPNNSRKGLRGILGMIENCTRFREDKLIRGKVRKLVLRLTRKASVSLLDRFQESREIDQIGDEIATEFLLDKTGVVWFTYLLRNTEKDTEIVFFIADKQEHKLSQKSPNSYAVNLNKTVSSLIKCARGKNFGTFGSAKQYCLSEIVVCSDFECRQNNSWDVSVAAALSSASQRSVVSIIVCFIYVTIALFFY